MQAAQHETSDMGLTEAEEEEEEKSQRVLAQRRYRTNRYQKIHRQMPPFQQIRRTHPQVDYQKRRAHQTRRQMSLAQGPRC